MAATGRPALAALAAAAGLLAFALAAVVGSTPAEDREMRAGVLGLAALVSSVGIATLAGAGALVSSKGVVAALGLAPGRLDARRIALLAVGTVGLSHAIDRALAATGWRSDSVIALIEAELLGARGVGLALALVGIGLAAGTAEELLFRGLVLRGVLARWGVAAGIAVSAALFGAVHLDAAQGLGAGLLGLYLGGVAVAAGSTRPAIVCHVVNNGAAVVLAALGAGGQSGAADLAAGVGAAGVGLVTLGWCFREHATPATDPGSIDRS